MKQRTSGEETSVHLRVFLNETVDDHDGCVTAVGHTEQQLVLPHTHTRTCQTDHLLLRQLVIEHHHHHTAFTMRLLQTDVRT